MAVAALIPARFEVWPKIDNVSVKENLVNPTDDEVPGTLFVELDRSTGAHAVSFAPADSGGGALGRIQLSRERLLALFDGIHLREEVKASALGELAANESCEV